MENFSGFWVLEGQKVCVERLASEGGEGALRLQAELPRLGLEAGAVDIIAQQRMPGM